jgi:anti-sigma28 factor (negative regulator of flagellin synthesis)
MKIYKLCQTEEYENIEEAIEWGGYKIDSETIEKIVRRDNLSYNNI